LIQLFFFRSTEKRECEYNWESIIAIITICCWSSIEPLFSQMTQWILIWGFKIGSRKGRMGKHLLPRHGWWIFRHGCCLVL
jgi:hypothetical protein